MARLTLAGAWRPLSLTCCLLALSACTPAPSSLPDELRDEFQPGLNLDQALDQLKQRDITFSVRAAPECEELVRQSSVTAQLAPRGGPCVFGKKTLSTTWAGGHQEVILQLVFTPDNLLVDANFEEVGSFF